MMKWLVNPCLALLVALLLLPASADAASAVVNLKMKGSGTLRIDNDVTGLGLTCGPNGFTTPDLRARTGVEVNACSYSTPLSCPGGAADCVVTATIVARIPQPPNIAVNDVDTNWKFSGWSPASTVPECPPSIGTAKTCTFAIGTCTASVCVGVPNLMLIADFRDDRKPVTQFGCRTATCPNQLPSISTAADGRTMFQARSDEYRIGEYTTIQCSVDGGAFVPCDSAPAPAVDATFLTPQVSEGSHTLRVRAIDPSGNVGDPSETRTWTQRYPPKARITGSFLGGGTSNPEQPFSFDNETGSPASFKCWFDAAAPVDCSTGQFAAGSPLLEGFHTFHVAAKRTDVADVEQVAPTEVGFTVDLTAPVAQIDSGPTDGMLTNIPSATFRFSAVGAAGFRCSLDGAPAEACGGGTVTYDNLASGSHTFALRAVDGAGNVQQPPVARTWTVLADADHDNWLAPADCDDTNAAVHPNATDVPGDGIDQDCAGGDAPVTDADHDGFAVPQDCDDTNPNIKPNAVEIPGNGIDENCDKVDPPNYDKDGDGFLADPKGKDCDDGNAKIHPGAKDVPQNKIDEDCDGQDGVYDVVGVRFPASWIPGSSFTTMVSVGVSSLPKDSRIHIRCIGKCAGGTRVLVVKKARTRYELKRFLDRRYPVGAELEVRVTKSKRSTEGSIWTMRRTQAPKQRTFCVFNGKRKSC